MGTVISVRACGAAQGPIAEDKCIQKGTDTTKVAVCSCTGDNCNQAASRMPVITATIVMPIIISTACVVHLLYYK